MAHAKKIQAAAFMTNGCPLRCTYCLTGQHKEQAVKKIDTSFVKVGFRDFYARFGAANLRFYGTGEPTTAFEEMQELAAFVRREFVASPTHLELQTSGYWVSEGEPWPSTRARWIVENIDTIWISLDAPPDVHDRTRILADGSSSRPAVEKSVLLALEYQRKWGRPFIGARPTITAQNVDRMREMLDYYHDLGVRTVWSHHAFEPVSLHNMPRHHQIARLDLMTMAERYVDAFHYAKSKGIWFGNFLAVNFDQPCEYACRTCLACPHFTTDGWVSACDMAYHGGTPLKELLIGKWDPAAGRINYYPERIEKLASRRRENMACRNCPAGPYCAGGCVGEAYFETGDLFGRRADHSRAVRYLASQLELPMLVPAHHP